MAAVSVKRFIESLGSVHAILDSVSSRSEKLLGIAKTATVPSLTPEYLFRLSGFQSSPLRIHFLDGPKKCTGQNLFDI